MLHVRPCLLRATGLTPPLAPNTFPSCYIINGLCLLPKCGEQTLLTCFCLWGLQGWGWYQRLLWRMALVLQVTGLDGNYRITCHTVMEVLREHKDSVMAVLEAFVYDPLLNWRLMDSEYEQMSGSWNPHPPDREHLMFSISLIFPLPAWSLRCITGLSHCFVFF